MSRTIHVAAAQMGPTQRADPRPRTLARLVALLEDAAARGAQLVVFPELAFTTFFPRWPIESDAELHTYYERAMPNPAVQPLFDRARALGVGFYVGYAELTDAGERFNSAITVGPDGTILGKYRKVHLPGSVEFRAGQRYQQLEKRYFAHGDLGFPTFPGFGSTLGMLICNDRRWPEAWRVLALGGAELVMVGYNSAAYDPNGGESENAELRSFHSTLVAQANAYMNSLWAVAVAKAGVEDGAGLIGSSCIVNPGGQVVAAATTLADEVIVADCDLDLCAHGRAPGKMFDFALHRRPALYARITAEAAATMPSTAPPPHRSSMTPHPVPAGALPPAVS